MLWAWEGGVRRPKGCFPRCVHGARMVRHFSMFLEALPQKNLKTTTAGISRGFYMAPRGFWVVSGTSRWFRGCLLLIPGDFLGIWWSLVFRISCWRLDGCCYWYGLVARAS